MRQSQTGTKSHQKYKFLDEDGILSASLGPYYLKKLKKMLDPPLLPLLFTLYTKSPIFIYLLM